MASDQLVASFGLEKFNAKHGLNDDYFKTKCFYLLFCVRTEVICCHCDSKCVCVCVCVCGGGS